MKTEYEHIQLIRRANLAEIDAEIADIQRELRVPWIGGSLCFKAAADSRLDDLFGTRNLILSRRLSAKA